MTATLTFAESARALEYVYVFLIEGCELAFTSYHTPADIKALWTATGHGSMTPAWRGGLFPEGTISTKIKLFDPKVETDTVTIKVLDPDDYVAGLVQSEALASAARTVLRDSTPTDALPAIDNNDTTVPVESTTAFDASGAIYVGHERITYSSKTGGGTPTFNGCTRGTLALFDTNGGTDFAYAHGGGTTIADGGQQVEVYSTPRVWMNRQCALYVLHREGSSFSDGASPLRLWAGRIKSIEDEAGVVSFEVGGIAECLDSLVFSSQFQADLTTGGYLPHGAKIQIVAVETSPATPANYNETSFIGAGTWSHEKLASEIADHLHLADVATSLYSGFELKLVPDEDSGVPRYRFRCLGSDSDVQVVVYLPDIVWAMLGFDAPEGILSNDGSASTPKNLSREGSTNYRSLKAAGPPLLHYLVLRPTTLLATADDSEVGTFNNQLNIPVESAWRGGYTINGYMMIDGKYLCAVENNGDTSFTIVQTDLGRIEAIGDRVPASGLAVRVPDAEGNRPIKIKQVFIEYGSAATQMLRLLLSTSVSAYNHATYDNLNDPGFGVGMPASLVDINSWLGIGSQGYWLVLERPTRFSEILEHVLEVRGAYLVWRRGKLAIARPGEPAHTFGDYDLTEENKADTKLTRYKRSNASVVNVCRLKYNRTIAGQYLDEWTVRAAASISDLKERKPVTIDGAGVYDGLLGPSGGLSEAVDTMAQALGYFSRPVCEVTRSYSHAVMGLAAGDTVNLTDERVIDPTTSTRGVTTWPCWVAETKFDLARGAGECVLVFLPEFHKEQRARWAPTAEVSSSSVASSRLTVTCVAHKYTPSTDTDTDSDYLDTAGMVLALRSVSPTGGVGTSYAGLVVHSAPGANQITFTTDPTAGAGLSTSLKWIVEFEDYSSVTASQQSGHAFIANGIVRQILGLAASFVRTWLGWVAFASEAVSYTTLYRRIVDLADDDGEPHSVGWMIDAANGLNCEFSYGTRQLLLAEMFDTDRTATTEAWIAGPIFVPLYGYNRSLTVRARCACSGGGTATVKFVASTGPPSGTSATSFTFPDGAAISVSVTRANASQDWTAEGTLANPSRMTEGRMAGMWLTVLASSSAGTATVTGIEVYETALS